MPLIILDRDVFINHDSHQYIRCLDDWQPIPGSIDAIARLSRAGFSVAIATNQSGLARGYFSATELEQIHNRMMQLVEEQGGQIDCIAHCPHLPDAGCDCRKPGTGLLAQIERQLGALVGDAYFIGDSLKDLQAAQAYGCRPVLVKTGKGEKTLAALQGSDPGVSEPLSIPIYNNLAEASQAILDFPGR